MAGVRSKELLKLGTWPAGIANRGPEEAMPTDEDGNVIALRSAKNVDIDERGKVRRRPGATLVRAAAGLHSIWAHDRFPYMLGVYDADIVLIDSVENVTPLGLGLTKPDAPMSFDLLAGAVYASNGTDRVQVLEDGSFRAWAAECPGGQPQVTVQAGQGGLAAGTYQVAITFLDADGREGGASLPVEVELDAGDGMLFTNFPVPADPSTTWVRIYCSRPNGEPLYAVQDIPVAMTSFLLGVHQPGAMLDKLLLTALPPGQIVRGHNGRQLVATGNLMLWSPALTYGLTLRHRAYHRYDAPLTLMEPAGEAEGSGLFVATAAGNGKSAGRTYYLTGPDPQNWQRVIAYPQGAVPGSAIKVDAKALGLQSGGIVPVWLADNGRIVAGLPGGQVIELHGDRYVGPARAERASLALREFNGMQHLIATLRGGEVSGLAATDLAVAEVWKDGVKIG